MDAAIFSQTASLGARPAAPAAKTAANGPAGGDAAREAAEEFEAVFLTTFLEGMFAGLKTDPPFGGGNSEKMYRSLMLGEYARKLSANGGLGIADHVHRELLAVQESLQK